MVVLVVRGSPEGPLVSPALWSFRLASATLYRGPCVVSTQCKHPTLTRSSDDQDDHGTTVFDRYCSTCLKTVADHFSRRFGTTIGPIKKMIHRRQSGKDRADWKKTILREITP